MDKGFVLPSDEKPQIIFYKNSPLEGVLFNDALADETTLEDGEIGVRAEPFFFSLGDLDGKSYKWLMNGNKIGAEKLPNVLNLRPDKGVNGFSMIDLRIQNFIKVMQSARKSLKINF